MKIKVDKKNILIVLLLIIMIGEIVGISSSVLSDRISYALPDDNINNSSITTNNIIEDTTSTSDITTTIENTTEETTVTTSAVTTTVTKTTNPPAPVPTTTAQPPVQNEGGKNDLAGTVNTYRNEINQVLEYMNQYRSEVGVAPLTLDEGLTRAATLRAYELSEKFDHYRPDGRDCFSVISDLGINVGYSRAENIARGQSTPQAVSNSWRNSTGHYRNITNPTYTKIGIGVVKIDGRYYWTELFAN